MKLYKLKQAPGLSSEYQLSDFSVQNIDDKNANEVIKRLTNAKFEAYIVGGALRNAFLGTKPKDFDIATNAKPNEIKRLFPRNSRLVGKRFPIVIIWFRSRNKIQNIEVVTFRKSVNSSYLPFRSFQDTNWGETLADDALRRDFTFNALYYSPIHKVIYDPFTGLEDLQNLKIKFIGVPKERIVEDPLRIMRALRMMASFNCSLDAEVEDLFFEKRHYIKQIHATRLRAELLKMMLDGNAQNLFKVLDYFLLVEMAFPQIADLDGLEFIQDVEYRLTTEVLTAVMNELDVLKKYVHNNEFHSIDIAVRVFQLLYWPKLLSLLQGKIDIGKVSFNVISQVLPEVMPAIITPFNQIFGSSNQVESKLYQCWLSQLSLTNGSLISVIPKNYSYVKSLASVRYSYGALSKENYSKLLALESKPNFSKSSRLSRKKKPKPALNNPDRKRSPRIKLL